MAIAIAVIIGIGGTFAVVPAMVGSFWMLANLAPVSFSGAELGVAPMLPVALIALFHIRRVRSACGTQITVRNIRVFAALSILVPVLLTALAWLVLWDASKVYDVAPPNILLALGVTVVLHAVIFIAGLGPKVWRALLLRRGMPTWPVEAARLAGRFVRWMLLAGLVAVVLQLLLNMGAVGDAYSIAPDLAGRLGLTLLSILYLPNLAAGGAAVLLGSEMSLGDASASLFAVTNANLPPLPVLAAMPHSALPFGEVLLVVPVGIAVFTVYRVITARTFVEAPVFTALGAGAFTAVLGLLVSWAAGGTLGYYGSTGPLLWLTPLLYLCWIVVPSAVVFFWAGRAGQKVTETMAEEEKGDRAPEDSADPGASADPAETVDADSTEDAGDTDDADADDAEGAVGAAGPDTAVEDADPDDTDVEDTDTASDTDDPDGADTAAATELDETESEDDAEDAPEETEATDDPAESPDPADPTAHGASDEDDDGTDGTGEESRK